MVLARVDGPPPAGGRPASPSKRRSSSARGSDAAEWRLAALTIEPSAEFYPLRPLETWQAHEPFADVDLTGLMEAAAVETLDGDRPATPSPERRRSVRGRRRSTKRSGVSE